MQVKLQQLTIGSPLCGFMKHRLVIHDKPPQVPITTEDADALQGGLLP